MATINISLPVDGDTIDAADYNTPITTIVNELNGNLSNANIATNAAISGSKLADASITNAKLDTTLASGWVATTSSVSSVTANGNRSYTVVTGSDLSSVVSPGMRLRTTRTVAAPTQSTSLNGSSQYYSKSSPAGMTFTDDFVVSAWVKLSSYPSSGSLGVIASRYNGTSGWSFGVNSSGTIYLRGYNAGSANVSDVQTYQSIPLNKWIHIAAQLDMSTFTATTTTSYIMLDGVDVPVVIGRTGTNPTALIQAGNLEVGSHNGGTSPLNGKIAQVAIYSAKVTQANVRATISQGLSGSESSLISAYSFNNSINDLNTSTANNLTANGSAVATNADSPFGGQADGTISSTKDYAIVQTISSTTINVLVPEGCTIPTSGGVSAVAYSAFKSPYGMPVDAGKWLFSYTATMPTYNITSSSGTITSVALPVLPSGVSADYLITGNFITNHAGGASLRDYTVSIRNGSTILKEGVNSAAASDYLKTTSASTIFTSTGGETINFTVYRNTDSGGTISNKSHVNITQLTSLL